MLQWSCCGLLPRREWLFCSRLHERAHNTVPATWAYHKKHQKNAKSSRRDRPWKEELYLPLFSGAVQGLDRGEVHCTSDKHPSANGRTSFRRSRKLKKLIGKKPTCRQNPSEELFMWQDVHLESFQSINSFCMYHNEFD